MLARAVVLMLLLGGLATAKPPELGDPLPKEAQPSEGSLGSMIRWPSRTDHDYPTYRILQDGVPFLVGVDDNRRIVFIWTDQNTFKTPDGVVVGSSVDEAKSIARAAPHCLMAMACYFPLPSGWNAGFLDSHDPSSRGYPPGSRVTFIFKSAWVK